MKFSSEAFIPMSLSLPSKKVLAFMLALIILPGPSSHFSAHGRDSGSTSQVSPLLSPDFAISTSPDSLTIPLGSTNTVKVTLKRQVGFLGGVMCFF